MAFVPRLVFINEEYWNLKVVAGDEELFVSIKKKKKAGVLQAYRLSLCDKCYRQDCFFNKHVEYCESVR